MKLGLFFTLLTKIILKQIKDLIIKFKHTIKLLEDNIGKNLPDIGLSNDFLDMTPKAQAIKANNQQLGLRQHQKLLHSKRNNQHN